MLFFFFAANSETRSKFKSPTNYVCKKKETPYNSINYFSALIFTLTYMFNFNLEALGSTQRLIAFQIHLSRIFDQET